LTVFQPFLEKPFVLAVRFHLRVFSLGIDEDERSTEEDRRVDRIGATLACSLILISSVFLLWHVLMYADIVGLILFLLFALWQHYLERGLKNTNLNLTPIQTMLISYVLLGRVGKYHRCTDSSDASTSFT
jgi:hypothetical protein